MSYKTSDRLMYSWGQGDSHKSLTLPYKTKRVVLSGSGSKATLPLPGFMRARQPGILVTVTSVSVPAAQPVIPAGESIVIVHPAGTATITLQSNGVFNASNANATAAGLSPTPSGLANILTKLCGGLVENGEASVFNVYGSKFNLTDYGYAFGSQFPNHYGIKFVWDSDMLRFSVVPVYDSAHVAVPSGTWTLSMSTSSALAKALGWGDSTVTFTYSLLDLTLRVPRTLDNTPVLVGPRYLFVRMPGVSVQDGFLHPLGMFMGDDIVAVVPYSAEPGALFEIYGETAKHHRAETVIYQSGAMKEITVELYDEFGRPYSTGNVPFVVSLDVQGEELSFY